MKKFNKRQNWFGPGLGNLSFYYPEFLKYSEEYTHIIRKKKKKSTRQSELYITF